MAACIEMDEGGIKAKPALEFSFSAHFPRFREGVTGRAIEYKIERPVLHVL